MSRALDDALEARQDAAIARALGISVDALDEHPYEIDENASDDGLVYSVRLLWSTTVPEGVDASGAYGSRWTDIHLDDEPDEPGE